MFKDKTILITGGTGSFGNAVARRFLDSDIKKIKIFSRDEKKQDDMRKLYSSEKLEFVLGDVRDRVSLNDAMRGVDYVFHAAAYKQVPSCEFYPMQAVSTNISGTENVLDSAIANAVEKVIVLSTDKAVYPINAMGMSKALAEKVTVAKSRNLGKDNTIVCCTRYGNVMASRGSVIPLFIQQIKSNKSLTITDPEMTRFMMSLDQAVELVLFAFENATGGDIFVQKAPAATMRQLADVMKKLFADEDYPIEIIGTRHGEKLYETLITREEMASAIDMGDYYRIPCDKRDLNYSTYTDIGESSITNQDEYHSHNTRRLTNGELKEVLLNLREIQQDIIQLEK